MADNIWEESKFNIKATVVGDDSKPYNGKVDILYLKDHDEANPLKEEKDQTLKNGKLERTYKVPKVDAKEATYELSIMAKYGDNKEYSSEVANAVVWPKTVKIHANELQKDGTKKDFKMAKLKVLQNGNEIAKPLTDKAGKCTVTLTEKVAYEIQGRDSYVVTGNQEDANNKRNHELTVERRLKARFVSPDVTKSPPWVANDPSNTEANRKLGVRQYVNLAATKKKGADGLGAEVLLEVSAKPQDDGKKGDKIYVEVTFSNATDRNDPKPELLNDPAVNDLDNSADPKVYTGYVELAKDGGTAKFKVRLGLAGGDTCTVGIGSKKDACTDETLTFVNWRRLWYELRYPKLLKPQLNATQDYADDLRNAITAHLAKAYIEYVKFRSHEFPDANATEAKKNGKMVPAAYLQEPAGTRYVVTNGWLEVKDKFSGDKATKSRSVYVSLCEQAFSSNVDERTYDDAVTSDDYDMAVPPTGAFPRYVFDTRTDTGKRNLVVKDAAGVFQWEADVAAHNQATKLVFEAPAAAGASAGKVKLVETRRAGKSVQVSFPKTAGVYDTALPAGEQTKVENFIADLLSSEPVLRDFGNQVTLRVVAPAGGDGDQDRADAVQAAAQTKFTAENKTINYHPGLDRNGAARKGDMKVEWLSCKDYQTIRVRLPKSPAGTPDYKQTLPGDFVGDPEDDTKCNVRVKFSYACSGGINGNSGGGYQIMVLRAAATADALAETVCHELGHAMGMTIVPGLNNDLVPPGMTADHIDGAGTSYVNGPAPYNFNDGKRSIHKGGHCANNVPNAKKNFEDFDSWSPTSASKGCIMWGSGDNVATRDGYCDTCVELVKGRRLDDIRSGWAGRGANDG